MNILVPGVITGIVGVLVGTSVRNSVSDIADSLKPLKNAIEDLSDMIKDYSDAYHELEGLYLKYQHGEDIDWNHVQDLKAELKIRETEIDNQVTVVAAIIEEEAQNGNAV